MSVSPSGNCSTVTVADDGSAVVASCGAVINMTGGGGVSDGDKGDITVSGTGTVWTIDNQAVTYAKIQNVAQTKLIGRTNASSGPPQEITVGNGLKLSGTTLSTDGVVSGTTTITAGTGLTGGVQALSSNVSVGVDFGTASGKVCEGNDARLSDARTPTSHLHGNVTNDGKIGTTPGLVVRTGSAGALTTLALGTAGQVLAVNSGANDIEWVAAGGGGGGTKTYAFFTPLDAQPPASNFATLDTRNSIAVLEFDAATEESITFVGIMPEAASLGSGLKVRIHWMADTATSGDCRWGVAFERMTTNLGSDSFDTVAEANGTANGTSGIPTVTEITITTIDSIVAGDAYRLKVYREAADAADTMTGDAQLIAVEVRSAA